MDEEAVVPRKGAAPARGDVAAADAHVRADHAEMNVLDRTKMIVAAGGREKVPDEVGDRLGHELLLVGHARRVVDDEEDIHLHGPGDVHVIREIARRLRRVAHGPEVGAGAGEGRDEEKSRGRRHGRSPAHATSYCNRRAEKIPRKGTIPREMA